MKLTFIFPMQAYKKHQPKHRTWFGVEPPTVAKLKSLVPDDIECNFFDERFEDIDFLKPTDLVVITINTFTAFRGYQIAQEYQNLGKTVIMGGIHSTLCPEEVSEYADATLVGEAEMTLARAIKDFRLGLLKKVYYPDSRAELKNVKLDRSIFKGKIYLPVKHLEISRGCVFDCSFCTIASLYRQKVTLRPIDEVIEDLKHIGSKLVAFIDEDASSNMEYRRELYTKMIPLKKKWTAQMTVKSLLNEELVALMAKSGCFNVFIGIETTNREVLDNMNKKHNIIEDYEKAYANCLKYDIPVSVGIIMGYDGDSLENAQKVFDYVNSHQHFMGIFTTFFPYPSTPAYEEIKKCGKFINEKWWMTETDPFTTPIIKYDKDNDFTGVAYKYMLEYLSYKNIFYRFWNSKYSLFKRLYICAFNLFMKWNFHSFG